MKKAFLLLSLISLSPSLAQDLSQDWPNLQKYRAANEAILASGDLPEVVFLGNSITEGWYSQRPEFSKTTILPAEASAARPLRRCSSASLPTCWT